MTANVLDFTGREPAWHGLGTIWKPGEQPSVVEGFRIAHADYEVQVVDVPAIVAFGKEITSRKTAIVRGPITGHDDDPRVLGYAGKGYSPLQNLEIAEAIEKISTREGWPLETVGVLGNGERVFCTLQADSYDLKGDPIKRFFLISDGKNGGTALRVAVVHVRVVCENTLMLALSDAVIDVATSHVGDVGKKLEFNLDVVAQMHAAQAAVTEAMSVLADHKLRKGEFDRIVDAAYDVTAGKSVLTAKQLLDSTITLEEAAKSGLAATIKKHDDRLRQVQVYKDAVKERFAIFNDEVPQLADTTWGAYNSVVEVEQYRRGKSSKATSESMLFGSRGQVSSRAFQEALAIASK